MARTGGPVSGPEEVFVSHAWASTEVEEVVDRFISALEHKLAYPPASWSGPAPRLWFDRRQVHGRSRTFDAQTLPAARDAKAGLFLVSNKWHRSPACQAEAKVFTKRGRLEHARLVMIQLMDRRSDNPPALADTPMYPELWDARFPTLLALDARGDAQDRDEFVSRIANEVFAILSDVNAP